jgi:hypothetical protein
MGTTWPMVAPPPFSGGDDQKRLVWMLETIRQTLHDLIEFNTPSLIPAEQRPLFTQNWPEVETAFKDAIATITKNHAGLVLNLKQAGMAGPMLEMKSKSLQRCVDGLYREVQTSSPIFSLKWLKPTSKCMNTIIGSLLRTVPGLEVAKEYKDHFEVAVDVMEAAKSE